jgi:hypothetical protein
MVHSCASFHVICQQSKTAVITWPHPCGRAIGRAE